MSDNFHRAHAFTAHWEGGFSDHPADTGGLTAYGASIKFVQGIAATQQGRDWLQRIGFRLPVNKASMRSVTPDMAEAMFKREFWDRLTWTTCRSGPPAPCTTPPSTVAVPSPSSWPSAATTPVWAPTA